LNSSSADPASIGEAVNFVGYTFIVCASLLAQRITHHMPLQNFALRVVEKHSKPFQLDARVLGKLSLRSISFSTVSASH